MKRSNPRKKNLISTLLIQQNFICHLCNQQIFSIKPKYCSKQKWNRFLKPTQDHIYPKYFGGTNNIKNIKIAHAFCNSIRGHEPILLFKMRLLFINRFNMIEVDDKFRKIFSLIK